MQTGIPEWWTSFLKEVTSTSKTVSIDIGVIGVQGKAMETRKTVIWPKRKKKNKKKKNTIKSHLKKFYVNSTEMYMTFACLLK